MSIEVDDWKGRDTYQLLVRESPWKISSAVSRLGAMIYKLLRYRTLCKSHCTDKEVFSELRSSPRNDFSPSRDQYSFFHRRCNGIDYTMNSLAVFHPSRGARAPLPQISLVPRSSSRFHAAYQKLSANTISKDIK
jgi:hypothetical protein